MTEMLGVAVCMAAVFITIIGAAVHVTVNSQTEERKRLQIELELSKVDRDILRHQRQIEELKKENRDEKERQRAEQT